MIFLNRAIPVSWCMLKHKSSTVKYEQYVHLLDRVEKLLPRDVEIIFLADRGFASKKLMCRLQKLRWTWRIRVKSNQKLLFKNRHIVPKSLPLSPGKALFFSGGVNFGKGIGNLSFSASWAKNSNEPWYVLTHFPEKKRRIMLQLGSKPAFFNFTCMARV